MPRPLLAAFGQDTDTWETVPGAAADEARVIRSRSAGIDFELRSCDVTRVRVTKPPGSAGVVLDVGFEQFTGTGAQRHPQRAVWTTVVGSGEQTRRVVSEFELVRFSTEPADVEAALHSASAAKGFDRRDVLTGDVTDERGTFKYNEAEMERFRAGARPFYRSPWLWVIVVASVLVVVLARAWRRQNA